MRYTHPDHAHSFTHYDEHELRGKTFEQLNHLMYVDRVLSDPRHNLIDPMDLEGMSDDELRAMLVDSTPVRVAPVTSAPAVKPLRVRIDPTIPRYRAAVWANGQSLHLGYYYTEELRDQAVSEAKARRDIGLPVRLTK